jgi:hypothetical protein
MKPTLDVIRGAIGALPSCLTIVVALVVGAIALSGCGSSYTIPGQHRNTTGENSQQFSQSFGGALGAAALVLSFKAIPSFFAPLKKRNNGALWLALAWLGSLGVAPLCILVPDLFPWQSWQLPYGTIHALEVVIAVWPFLLLGIWKLVVEIYRRKGDALYACQPLSGTSLGPKTDMDSGEAEKKYVGVHAQSLIIIVVDAFWFLSWFLLVCVRWPEKWLHAGTSAGAVVAGTKGDKHFYIMACLYTVMLLFPFLATLLTASLVVSSLRKSIPPCSHCPCALVAVAATVIVWFLLIVGIGLLIPGPV